MRQYRNYFAKFILFVSLGLPVVMAADFWLKRRDPATDLICTVFNASPKDVIYLGDSTIRFTGSRDTDKTGIDQFFLKEAGLSTVTIAKPGYSAILFANYVKLLKKTKFRPKLVIIPINLRSFSESGVQRPAARFSLQQIYSDYRATGSFNWYEYLKFRYFGEEERLTKLWENQPVVRGGISIGTNREVIDQSRIREVLDYTPEREAWYKKELALKFSYHYLMDIPPEHLLITKLKETISTLASMNIKVLCYITPLDMESGRRYVGKAFDNQVNQNLNITMQELEKSGVKCLDLHNLLSREHFVHKSDVHEHLDTSGRQLVGTHVAKRARQQLLLTY